MNGSSGMHLRLGKLRSPRATAVVALGSLGVAIVLVARAADADALRESASAMADQPGRVGVALAAFAAAFAVRALVWCRVLPGLSVGHALAGLHVSLGANHILPLRLGEPMRVVSVVRRARIPLDAASASTLALRSADILAVAVVGAALGPAVFLQLVGPLGWVVFAVIAALGTTGLVWLIRVRRHHAGRNRVRLPGMLAVAGSLVAWILEAVLVWECARFAGIELAFRDAVLVTTASVAAQTVAIAPSGIGTYEAAATAAYVALGYDAGAGLTAAIVTHALKTAYSLAGGALFSFIPAPSLFGRARLPRDRALSPVVSEEEQPIPLSAPVVLFLPAHNEEATVGGVVARTPTSVVGHPVRCVVVDDGSTDDTAGRAAAAGAEVISLPTNSGLGAAVRVGLDHALASGAAAVAFCDADGEYAPEELERLVGPILDGRADYVVGSRFSGTILAMRPHRRLGNLVLTKVLSFIARTRITDGQSGYRALSARAARAAHIEHDFNYAQVLTLDLLAKGFRYLEVPITYRFRTEGRSFITLGRYVRNVVPAVYRVLNRPQLSNSAS
ncbi:MAG: lysylphosphatidylglycerol synthase domain-containing protein [Acidimicrobiales bacterium]|nr:lysylphosphatidylglycerol synthase domain-containing protein [Acidimicrobiales bacterium]